MEICVVFVLFVVVVAVGWGRFGLCFGLVFLFRLFFLVCWVVGRPYFKWRYIAGACESMLNLILAPLNRSQFS